MSADRSPKPELDHIVVAARSLDEGRQYIRDRLGVDIPPGGKHPLMGTHNCLMRLGTTAFLEVIAIDPDAGKPNHPRWYSLDDPAMKSQLDESPRLVAWVLRSRNIEHDALMGGYSPDDVIPVSRGTLNWRLTVPAGGSMSWGGVFPHIIQWDGDVRPWERMDERNTGLVRLHLCHPDADRLASVLTRLMGGFPNYLEIATAEKPGIEAELNVSGRSAML